MRSRRAEIIDQIRPPHRTPMPLDARRSVSSRARRRRAANGRAHARAAGGRAGTTSGPIPAAPRALTRVGRALGPIRRRRRPERSIVGTGPRAEQADGVRDHAVVHRSLHITVAPGGMDNIVGISTQRGGSAKAPGDALTVHALNRGTDAVLRRVAVARVIDPARQRAVTWRRGSVVGATTSCRGWGAFSGSSQEVALDYTLYLIPA